MWGLMARRESFGFQKDLQNLSPEELRAAAFRQIDGFHPTLRRFIAEADPSTLSLLHIRSAPEVQHWQTSKVTVLGDAIHSMTPAAGVGANTALKDASVLCKELISATQGQKTVNQALYDYEVEMLRFGFSSVRLSLRNAKMAVAQGSVRRMVTRCALRTINAFIKWKRNRSKSRVPASAS
jgi:2-polyprenyl-6-methoxyphenol hydroxylase-like FAD-dependent oxidoreductase